MNKTKSLNEKRRTFVNEYLVDKNATRAARAAGYSSKTAKQAGSRLLTFVDVAEAITNGLQQQAEKADLKAADILAELRKVAFADIGDAFGPDGRLLPLSQMPEGIRAALAAIETNEKFTCRGEKRTKVGETKRIKLNDKLKALELLGKHFKLFTDIQEVTGTDNRPQVILSMPADGSEGPDYAVLPHLPQ